MLYMMRLWLKIATDFDFSFNLSYYQRRF